ncbi:MAG: ExbD/TolR family protein [Pseudobdellovibrionaceae bacterium]|jgi:biopolymer transport protein ExbD
MAGMDPSSQDDSALMNSINVTPFVDVVLVLLVIFMITAPMLVKDIIGLQLPKTSTSDGQTTQTLAIAVNKQGNVLLNGQPVDDATLTAEITKAISNDSQTQAVIAADVDVPYGRVMKVIDLMKSAGLQRFAVQIEKQDTATQ